MAMTKATTSTQIQLIILLPLLASFLVWGSTMSHEARRGSTDISVTSHSLRMPKTMKCSCQVTLGLCNHSCLMGCCNERCSNQFKNGVGKCLEPMLPRAPCLCQYTC
ncbi:hypothetical protein Lser_V15G45937 [Lactuca serriola]